MKNLGAEEVKAMLDQKMEIGFGQDTEGGDPIYMRVSKFGAEIYLTADQARSLAVAINDRFSPKKTKSAS